jgi:hypothetical protein
MRVENIVDPMSGLVLEAGKATDDELQEYFAKKN